MTINALLEELGVEFQPDERSLFLEEVSKTARDMGSTLDASAPLTPAGESAQRIQELTSELDKDVAEFSPRLQVIPLNERDFAMHSLALSPDIAALMTRFNFYLVNIPITLFPKAGCGFVQLNCIVEFSPGIPTAERAVAYQIFPDQEWQDIIKFEQGLAVGLDEKLEFKVDTARLKVEMPALSSEAKAAIGVKAAGNAGLVLGPFNYKIRRPKIQTAGRGNVKVHWRLDSAEYFEQEEPRLGVLLQVPKQISRVDAVGVLKATRDVHFLTANLRNVLELVRERTRNFFETGTPKTAGQPWLDIMAGL